MKNELRKVALAIGFVSMATSASAVSVTPFDTPLAAGDSTFGNAVATSFEDFASTMLSFTASEDLTADVTGTINPFLVSPSGVPSNTISLGYSINGGATAPLSVSEVVLPTGSIGATGVSIPMLSGDTVSFFIEGSGGASGNQVTFAIETEAPVVPLSPALGFALTGVAALGLVRRRRKS